VSCNWTRVRIPAYIDGELGAADVAQLREHLAGCAGCTAAEKSERDLLLRVRSVARAEKAPAGLAERIRNSLAEVAALEEGQASAAPGSPARVAPLHAGRDASRRTLRGRIAWGSLLAAAAVLLVFVALPWSAGESGLVNAMAAEHYKRLQGADYGKLSLVSSENSKIEKYLSKELGLRVQLPPGNVPTRRGACFCRSGGRKMGIVGCFCPKRGKAITLFVFEADGANLADLELLRRDGREFLCGSSGKCQAVIWKRGKLCYALVGNLEAADLCEMARRAAAALEGKVALKPESLASNCDCGCSGSNCSDMKR
jgi:anti-sigma factor (TIGR02949 family)